jgi:hypothetical protein
MKNPDANKARTLVTDDNPGRLSSADLRAALAAAPEGPWTPSACNGDADVDRGKVWAHLGWPIRSVCLLSANTKLDDIDWRAAMTLAALAPDLAAEVLELRERIRAAVSP